MKPSRTGAATLALAAMLLPVPSAAQSSVGETNASRQPESGTIALSLEDAVQLGVTRSFRAARAKRNEDIAGLRHSNARSGYLPRVDLAVSGEQTQRSYDEQGIDYDPYAGRSFRGGLNSSLWMPIDVSGTVKRQVDQAQTWQEISAKEVYQTKLDLAFDVQNNYLNALRAQQNVTADQRVVDQIKALLERSRDKAPGVVPFLEVELGNAQQSLTNSRTSADQAQDGLKQSLRIPLETRLHLTTEMNHDVEPETRGDLLQQAIAARPDVQQARLRIRQAEITAKQVTDSRKPSVSIGGYLNQEMVGGNPVDHDSRRISNRGLGLNVKLPLAQFDGGQLGRQKKIANLQKEQAVADADELKERVAYDLRQALLAVERAEARITSVPDKQQAFAALKRAEEQMLSAPDGQAQSLLAQVSNARNAWRSAETASADADIDYNRALFRLKRTMGDVDGIEQFATKSSLPPVPIVSSSSL
ncbi:MAG: TolC family protein [Sphingomicrobium sp.]